MVNTKWMLRTVVALLVAASAGCGGGGGGGEAEGAVPTAAAGAVPTAPAAPALPSAEVPPAFPGAPAGQVVENLAISLMAPASVRETLYAGMTLPRQLIDVTWAGDISLTFGHTVYTYVVPPAGIAYGSPELSVMPEYARLILTGSEPLTAGKHEGSMAIHVCLDAECRRPLKNSPLLLPYSIDVRPGLEIPVRFFDVNLQPGVAPAPIAVNLKLPAETIDWTFRGSVSDYASWYRQEGNQLIIAPPAARPKAYWGDTVKIYARVPYGSGIVELIKEISVSYWEAAR